MKAVVLTFDCLPVRLLGCYGNEAFATPNFDRLAAESVVFDSHFCNTFDPESTGAWWKDREAFAGTSSQHVESASLPQTLAAHGVELSILDDAAAVGSRLNELRSARSTSWLICINVRGFSFPSLATDGADPIADSKAASRRFADVVTSIDLQLGTILNSLQGHIDDDALLIATARRGADLGERAESRSPQLQLCTANVHLPLIVQSPSGERYGRRSALTQSVDLVATLLDWFAVESVELSFRGVSLLPRLRGQPTQTREVAYFYSANGERGARTNDFYLIEAPEGRPGSAARWLFKKPDDMWDILDVAGQFSEVADKLQAGLPDTNRGEAKQTELGN